MRFLGTGGLISEAEQAELLNKLVVIAGCGGVGGFHAHTLARLGIGRFRISDPDEFSVGNFNRQIGANLNTVDRNKAEVTAEIIYSINPSANVEVISGGMSFEEYFAFSDDQNYYDQIVNFVVGLTPSALHIPYMDLSGVDPSTGRGPSSVIGVQLAASLTGAEAVRIFLNRNSSDVSPFYLQFDAYRYKFKKCKIGKGNYAIVQKIKRRLIFKKFKELGLDMAFERLANE